MRDDQVCGSCDYWEENEGSDVPPGWCHRYAPRPVSGDVVGGDLPDAVWLATDRNDWCGEWRPVKGKSE